MKRWELLPCTKKDITDQLLENRGIDFKNKEDFFKPNFDKLLSSPFKILNLEKAAERILKAVEKKEKIGIFADYDHDGTPAAVFLMKFINFLWDSIHDRNISRQVSVYIPSRQEGYGLSEKGIRQLKREGCSLIITVDLGITGKEQVKKAKELGIETIVIDHHEVIASKFPNEAFAVVNPKQKEDKSNFKEFSAGGLCFKLAVGLFNLYSKLHKAGYKDKAEYFLKWNLDLPAISTICDMVPLLDQNRIIAKFGLIVLSKTKNLGLRKLYQSAGIMPENIGTYTVSFQIGPRLNAPGRMDDANQSFYLLKSQDEREAEDLALYLNRINRKRQAELERVLKEARKEVEEKKLHHKKVILVSGKNWPAGIVGLVAGKLMEQYARPTVVLEVGEKISRGSARSIDGFHIVEAFEEAKEYLLRHGGHAKAGGLSLENKHLQNLYDRLLELAETKLKDEDLTPKIKVDAEIEKKDLNYGFWQNLKKFEPHGLGNPRPTFLMKNLIIDEVKTVGSENKHLKLRLSGLSAIGFDFGPFGSELRIGDNLDVVFNLDENNYNGVKNLQLRILDLKKSE